MCETERRPCRSASAVSGFDLRSPVKPTRAVLDFAAGAARADDYSPGSAASRSTPCASRRGSREAKHQRSQPSPSGPKAAPGARPRPALGRPGAWQAPASRARRRRAKKAYRPPGGVATATPGSAREARQQRVAAGAQPLDQRRAPSASACASAARPARCTNTGAHEVLNSISLASAATKPGGSDDPAQAPAGHQEALREAVHDEQPVVGLGDVEEARRAGRRRRRRRPARRPRRRRSRCRSPAVRRAAPAARRGSGSSRSGCSAN